MNKTPLSTCPGLGCVGHKLRHALAFTPAQRDIDCAQLLAHFRQPASWWRFGA